MSDLLKRDRETIWHPFTPINGGSDPIIINSGKGVYLYTEDDKSIIDAVSSWWVNIHGHANPVIAKAIVEQALTLEHVIFAGFTHKPAIDLARNLLSILPSNQSRIFFSDDGSTAVEVGIKMAVQFWFNAGETKRTIVALEGAYHGDTFGAMSVGERGMFTAPFQDMLFDVKFIPFPTELNQREVVNTFQSLVSTGDVAAFIFEPLLQGAGGMRTYSSLILDELISVAHQHEVICIADEVMTGFGRTGKLFACDYLTQQPDIMAISKGITGGTMALGVTTCAHRIVAGFASPDFTKTFFHGHSYTANPLACAAANASFSILVSDECQQQIALISRLHVSFAQKMTSHRNVIDARSLGTMVALELRTSTGTSYDNELRKKIYPYFMDRGILLRPLGNTIYILPPYVITPEELQLIYSAIEAFVELI